MILGLGYDESLCPQLVLSCAFPLFSLPLIFVRRRENRLSKPKQGSDKDFFIKTLCWKRFK